MKLLCQKLYNIVLLIKYYVFVLKAMAVYNTIQGNINKTNQAILNN